MKSKIREILQNILLFLASLFVCFILIEVGYRMFDPRPYFPVSERNEAKELTQFDSELGWKGSPGKSALFVTQNAKTMVQHNRLGFRDVEPDDRSPDKPAICFLGDSFTWGYNVEFEQMFTNSLRKRLIEFEVFNLSHRGYGTDQSLLIFQNWSIDRPLKLVVLMFFENDIEDNNTGFRSGKSKPKFRLVNGNLILDKKSVSQDSEELKPQNMLDSSMDWKAQARHIFFHSHFLHDLYFRIGDLQRRAQGARRTIAPIRGEDFELTKHIVRRLRDTVEARGAKLLVVAIPSKNQFAGIDDYKPYQLLLESLCEEEKIEYLDLAPALENTLFRTYYKFGIHWTPHGHHTAEDAIYRRISSLVNKPW